MTAKRALYEVDWQLPDCEEPRVARSGTGNCDEQRAKHPVRDRKHPVRDHVGSMARLAGVLAGADAVAIVGCRASGLVIESSQPLTAALPPGTVVPVHPCLGGRRTGPFGSLLSGPRRWCRCLPPRGFAYAALVASPSLAHSGRMLLVANRQRRLTELNLRVASAYLAQEHDAAPSQLAPWQLAASQLAPSQLGPSQLGRLQLGRLQLGSSQVVDLRSP
ncbi:MAG TPA: hypothetical protein VEJ84_17155 [Acidimicrobiales bacterium]|nr:hypothetical protein [Acidimicrobiales bacterium]